MEATGTRITLKITDPVDLNRDVLKVWLKRRQYNLKFHEAKKTFLDRKVETPTKMVKLCRKVLDNWQEPIKK